MVHGVILQDVLIRERTAISLPMSVLYGVLLLDGEGDKDEDKGKAEAQERLTEALPPEAAEAAEATEAAEAAEAAEAYEAAEVVEAAEAAVATHFQMQ